MLESRNSLDLCTYLLFLIWRWFCAITWGHLRSVSHWGSQMSDMHEQNVDCLYQASDQFSANLTAPSQAYIPLGATLKPS